MDPRSRAIVAVVGITDYAQEQLGDVVYVELPEIGRQVEQGQGGGGRRIGQGGERGLCAGLGRGGRGQRRRSPPTRPRSTPTRWARAGSSSCGSPTPSELDGLMDEAAYQALCRGAALMRYLPLTEADRARDAGGDRRPTRSTRCSPTCRRRRGSTGCSTCRGRWASSRSSARLGAMAAKNVAAGSVPFFIGAGAYRHHVPAAVDHLIQRGEFLTSYTPYQPEIAQGTLQYLFEFQTQVALLTGMEVANASLYDGATACAEAVLMANRVTAPQQGGAVGRAASALPRGHARPMRGSPAFELVGAGPGAGRRRGPRRPRSTARPPASSCRTPISSARSATTPSSRETCHDAGALLVVVVTEILSLGALTPPGEMGADIVAAEGQSIGNALNFGGPYVGLFATPRQIRAPDAGPARRRDRRCRGPARLGADAVDPRAAHPAREGDQQHLHQFRAVRARLHDPSVAARRGRADAAGAAQPRHGGRARRAARAGAAASSSSTRASSTNSRCGCRKPAAPVVEALAAARHPRRRAGQPLLSGAGRSRRSAAGGRDRDRRPPTTSTARRPGCAEVL